MTLIQSTGRMYLEASNPTINDDTQNGYEEGNFWKNVLLQDVFQCREPTDGAAVWSKFAFNLDDVEFGQLKTNAGQIVKITSPLSYPYNVLPGDYIVLVDSSSPRTINMPSPAAGQMFVIKDKSGNSLLNNITISGNGVNIDGVASIAIALNFGSIFLITDGFEWYTL